MCLRKKRVLAYEDVYPLLYLKYRLCRVRDHKNIKHLVIDEMQDYSYLQYLILRQMFNCRMTILGDRAQTMEEQTQDVLEFLPGIFGKDIRKIILNKSYREHSGDCRICQSDCRYPGYGDLPAPRKRSGGESAGWKRSRRQRKSAGI